MTNLSLRTMLRLPDGAKRARDRCAIEPLRWGPPFPATVAQGRCGESHVTRYR